YFDWSFYSQGTRREGDPTAHRAPDATRFIAEALEFFGDVHMANSNASPWDKGHRLSLLVSQYRTLLILDGLEPLQAPPGPSFGELRDDGMRALLNGLRVSNRGLCVVTTRERVADLVGTEDSYTPRWNVGRLSDEEGAEVLAKYGVLGDPGQLARASDEV